MKTFNEQTDLRIASLTRQRAQIQRQIDALQIYRAATKPTPKPPAQKRQTPPKTTPSKAK